MQPRLLPSRPINLRQIINWGCTGVMRGRPSISVVMPLYNKAECVVETLSAAASQIGAEFEIIVVDDGSKDGSGELVKMAGVPHLRVIEQTNAGVSAARNRGIAAARGEWIAFLDADDLWSQDHLAGLLQAVEGSDVVAAFSNARLQSRAGRPTIEPRVSARRIDDYFSFALSNGGYPMGTSAIIIRRNQFRAAGLFAEGVSIGEDVDMWCRLACLGPFFYNAEVSATYNDAGSETRGSYGGRAARPVFTQRLPDLIRDGKVPPALLESARRYANFLMLEYARQLLDAGRYAEARNVLLHECFVLYDPGRSLKRLARTTFVGRTLFGLIRGGVRKPSTLG